MTADVIRCTGIAVLASAAVLCAAAAVAGVRRERAAERRAVLLLAVGGPDRSGWWRRWSSRACRSAVRSWSAAVGALLTGLVLVGGPVGCVLGLVAAYGLWRGQRAASRRTGDAKGRRGEPGSFGGTDPGVAEQLPLAADLLAACLAAGAEPRQAAEAVGKSLGGPIGEQLVHTSAELLLGGEPSLAWGRLAGLPGARELARCLEHAATVGVPAVESVSRVAADCRAEQARAAGARARRAGVLAAAPLGLCFLPAFLLLGVAPVVIGLADGLTTGG
jgi:hypothetical protein